MNKTQLLQYFRLTSRGLRLSSLLLFVGLTVFFSGLRVAEAEFGSIVDIGLGGDFFFTQESANNGQGYVNLLIQNNWSDSQLWLDVGAGGLIGETASSYVKAPQFYYRMGQVGKFNITIGRALHDWSEADEFWNLGLVQPVFKWSEARPEQQGLVGLFMTLPIVANAFEMTAFYSPLFIPSQGPSYDLSDGEFSSSNPWFNEPASVIDLSGNRLDINFDVDMPPITDIVQQNSFGLQFATPRNKKNFIFNAFGFSKPRNDLVLPFRSPLVANTGEVNATVVPVVAQHNVAGFDLGWNFSRFKTTLSYLYESEVDYDIPVGSVHPKLPEQNIFSLNQLIRLTQSQRLWLGYMRVDAAATQTLGAPGNTQSAVFQGRNRFDEVARLQWDGLLFKTKSFYKVNASFAYNQSLVRDNVWVSTDVRWSIYRGIEAFSQCDFFGGSEQVIDGVDFISTYQNNDRCLVGGHYAF